MKRNFIGESGKWVLNTNNLNWIDVREGYMKDGKPSYCVVANFVDRNELSLFEGTEMECKVYLEKIVRFDMAGIDTTGA